MPRQFGILPVYHGNTPDWTGNRRIFGLSLAYGPLRQELGESDDISVFRPRIRERADVFGIVTPYRGIWTARTTLRAGLGILPGYRGYMGDVIDLSAQSQPAGLPGFIANAAGKQRELGRAPAAQPTKLIQQPIWWNSRKATRYATTSRSYSMRDAGVEVTYVAETSNAVPTPQDGERSRDSPHGLLRYSDLDVLMALSYHFTRYGKPLVEVDQRTILTWMGYQQFDEAPYRELRASLQRMASTTISVSMKGAKIADYIPSRLVALHGMTEGGGHGAKGTIKASLTEEWRQSLGKGFTLVDMHAYAHLCRVDRECGLARVLFLFFASLKVHANGQFNVPLSWVSDRWRDTTGVDQTPVFADPLDRKGQLFEALCLLHSSGVMSVGESNEDDRGRVTAERRLCGTFAPAANIPRIPEESGPRQIALFVSNRFTGLPAPADEDDHTQPPPRIEDAVPAPPSSMAPADVLRSEKSLFVDACIAALIQDLGLSQRAIKKAMKSDDWSNRSAMARMLLDVAWRYRELRTIDKPAGYVMRILTKGASDDPQWAKSEAEAQKWAMSPGGPLHRLASMRDRIRELEKEVRKLPSEDRKPTLPNITDQHAADTRTVSPEALAEHVLADLGVQVITERVKLLASIGDEQRMVKTASRLKDDWLDEDRASGDVADDQVDEDLVAAVAKELAEHRQEAHRLGYTTSPVAERFKSATEIVRSADRLRAWRQAISA